MMLKKMFIIILVLAFIPSVVAYGTSVDVEPSRVRVTDTGEEFTIDINVNDVVDLTSYILSIGWDPEMLYLDEYEWGDFIDSLDPLQLGAPLIGDSGSLPEVTSSSMAAGSGVDGSGLLLSLHFTVVGEPPTDVLEVNTTITLSYVYMANSEIVNSTPLPITGFDINHGTISLLGQVDILALAGSDQVIDEGKQTTFDGSKSMGEIQSWKWKIFDETTEELEGKTVKYTFQQPGEYEVELTVSNGEEESTDKLNVKVRDVTPPEIMITTRGLDENDHVKEEYGTVEFNASGSYDPEKGKISSYWWDFGDKTSNTAVVNYTFEESGLYYVHIEVKDVNGNVGEYDMPITVGDYQYGNRTIDLFSNGNILNGRGKGKKCDPYQPLEEVILYAKALYNGAPKNNAFISYQIFGPMSNNPIRILRSASTNISGISEISFRIPAIDRISDQEVLGEWNVEVTAQIGDETVTDQMAFNVYQMTYLTNIKIYNRSGIETLKFLRGDNILLDIGLENIGNLTNSIDLELIMLDSDNNKIYLKNITNIEIEEQSEIVFSEKIPINVTSSLGQATISIRYCPSFYKELQIDRKNDYSKNFIIFKREMTLIRTQVQSDSVMEGTPYTINVFIANYGLKREKSNLNIYYDNQLIETVPFDLSPNSNRNIVYTWNTTGVPEGNHTLYTSIDEFTPSIIESDTNENQFILTPEKNKTHSEPPSPETRIILNHVAVVYPSITEPLIQNYVIMLIAAAVVINMYLNSR